MESFSAQLRQASIQDHAAAESTSYIGDLMAGTLPVTAYAALSVQLHAVYSVLEEASDAHRERPVAGPFCFEELRRRPALEADLALLLGPDWAKEAELTEATRAYVERLREVAFDWPGGFVAHHYVRYMGDLSGGQIIGRGVERAYALEGGAGAQFYRFPLIPKPKNFKDAYRALLDEAPFDAAERDRIVAEVRLAYRLNTDVLIDLGALVKGEAA
ncbi:biliverdin-producing heme oxygenase [Actinocorallia longicatena]|uniref:Biliverdin-producing heme oxygenase n=1 Tax=Actinocorallia longicatena TaxID=111803 RepID=A0ABP6Q7T3_9ACTN